MFYVIMKFKNYILCYELYIILITNFQYLMIMFYDIMRFKNYILCHELYIILITNFQYLMKFIYKSNVL